MKCAQPGCGGRIVDGYCDVCGMASVSVSSSSPVATGGADPVSAVSRAASSTLGSVPLGSIRNPSSQPTRRLGPNRAAPRLGAGLTTVPPVPTADPRQALMDPAVVAEEKRFCAVCNAPVGRGRDGQPGRTKGFCAKCRTPFDVEPKLSPGTLIGGQYEIVGCLAHGGMGWIYLARDRNVNDRWVVVKGLLNSGDPDAARAAVAEKQYLAEVEHPLIVEIYNFVTAADGTSYIVMEYVGGRSLNQILKDRIAANGGRFSPIDVDQAIAYMIEVLPAFSYLHSLGLLYCDFKPANVIQVGDGIKLIDLGGVRRIDDDVTAIYGTVGFQAPEVPADGPSVASDLFTVGRTLAVLVFDFIGYQSEYVATLPSPEQVPVFAAHDSLYRWLLKATALAAHDRFQTAEEMREQLLGVLRDVTAGSRRGAVTASTTSRLFGAPQATGAELAWSDLPQLAADPNDPSATWLSSLTIVDPRVKLEALSGAPQRSVGVMLAEAHAALTAGMTDQCNAVIDEILAADPWEWRAVWLQGLGALRAGQAQAAVEAFNAVYGQVPGELAPKLALALACEHAAATDVAARLYEVCAATDANYVAPGQFGLARLAAAAGQEEAALAALASIPATSRAYGVARRKRIEVLAELPVNPAGGDALDRLAAAGAELDTVALDPVDRQQLTITVLNNALAAITGSGTGGQPSRSVAGVRATEADVRAALETAWRELARLEPDQRRRWELVDRANAVRPRTIR